MFIAAVVAIVIVVANVNVSNVAAVVLLVDIVIFFKLLLPAVLSDVALVVVSGLPLFVAVKNSQFGAPSLSKTATTFPPPIKQKS